MFKFRKSNFSDIEEILKIIEKAKIELKKLDRSMAKRIS